MYKNTTTKEPKTAQNDSFLISSAMVGLTLLDNTLPTPLVASENSVYVISAGKYDFNPLNNMVWTSSSASAEFSFTLYFVEIFN